MSEPTVTRDEALTALREAWPAWQVWTVPLAVGGTVWCAKRLDGRCRVLNAYEAEHLEEYLAEAEAPPSGLLR